jgi:VWFA-related protein
MLPPKTLCHAIFILVLPAAVFTAAGRDPAARSTAQEAAAVEDRQQQAAGESFKIKVDVDLVTTDVTVIGSAPELRAEDFIVYDNGVAQTVSHFSRDQYPLAVAVLIDGSLSIRPYLPLLQVAAASALRRLKPEDQVVLYSFNSGISRHGDLTEDRIQIADRIGKIQVALGTNIYGTIFEAANYLYKKAPRRRRAIILVSDNCHAMGTRSAESCGVELLETNTTLYNIRTPGDNASAYASQCFQSDTAIRRLAADTGGEVFDAQRPISLQDALEKAISALRLQYTLGFNPSSPGSRGSFHRLEVKLASGGRCPGCRLLARRGYYAGVTAPLPPPETARVAPLLSPQRTDQLLVQRSIMTAGSIDVDLPGIPFAVRTKEQTGSGGEPQVQVDLAISLAGVAFKNVDGKRACRLCVAIFCADSKGKILGSDWKNIEGQLSDEAYRRALNTGINYSAVIPLKDKRQIIKIVVYDEQSDKVGSRLVRFR